MELQRYSADLCWKPEYMVPVHFSRMKAKESVEIQPQYFAEKI